MPLTDCNRDFTSHLRKTQFSDGKQTRYEAAVEKEVDLVEMTEGISGLKQPSYTLTLNVSIIT